MLTEYDLLFPREHTFDSQTFRYQSSRLYLIVFNSRLSIIDKKEFKFSDDMSQQWNSTGNDSFLSEEFPRCIHVIKVTPLTRCSWVVSEDTDRCYH